MLKWLIGVVALGGLAYWGNIQFEEIKTRRAERDVSEAKRAVLADPKQAVSAALKIFSEKVMREGPLIVYQAGYGSAFVASGKPSGWSLSCDFLGLKLQVSNIEDSVEILRLYDWNYQGKAYCLDVVRGVAPTVKSFFDAFDETQQPRLAQ